MGLTGLIFGGIAAAWLVYLVPYFLTRRAHPEADDVDPAEPFSGAVTIVRRGADLALADEGTDLVSTPLTRRAALFELSQIDAQAAQRRRRTLIVLLLVLLAAGGLAAFRIVSAWVPLIPLALIVAFVVVARVSVKAMRADLARRAARIHESREEETVALRLTEEDVADHEVSVELSAPLKPAGSLWDPIPITAPTYVSKPLAPRTVRTIDLSAPLASTNMEVPVVAETPERERPESDEGQRDVG